MSNKEIRETLEKQLQLLSERSQDKDCTTTEICSLTSVMTSLAIQVLSL